MVFNSKMSWLSGSGLGYPFWLGQNPQPNPYGSFSSTQTQTVTGVGVTTVLTYNTTDIASQIYNTGGKIYVQASGIYRLLYSVQLDTNTGGPNNVAYIWVRKNGVNVANTTTIFIITNTEELAATCETILYLSFGDYVEVVFQSQDAGMKAIAISAGGVAPNNYPAIPSIITNIQKIA